MKITLLILLFCIPATTVRPQLVSKKDYIDCLLNAPFLVDMPPFARENNHQGYHYGDSLDAYNQLRDTLIYEGKTLLIYRSPLLDFKENKIVGDDEYAGVVIPCFQFKNSEPSCWRRFVARWEIHDGILYLTRVTPQKVADESKLTESAMRKRAEDITGRKFKDGKLFAGWVTGTVSGGYGVYYNGYYIYPKEYLFKMHSGEVKKVRTKTKNK